MRRMTQKEWEHEAQVAVLFAEAAGVKVDNPEAFGRVAARNAMLTEARKTARFTSLEEWQGSVDDSSDRIDRLAVKMAVEALRDRERIAVEMLAGGATWNEAAAKSGLGKAGLSRLLARLRKQLSGVR